VKKAALQTKDKKSMPDELVNHKLAGGMETVLVMEWGHEVH
jgi:hypothetical protein